MYSTTPGVSSGAGRRPGIFRRATARQHGIMAAAPVRLRQGFGGHSFALTHSGGLPPEARKREGWWAVTGSNRRHSRCRSEEHTSELQSLMRISYAVFCLKKKQQKQQ